MWARWREAGPKAEDQTQKCRCWGFQCFDLGFGHWSRTLEVINVKRWITPGPKQKKKENKMENKRNNKTSKTNHTFATKKVREEKHEHKATTWKNTITKTNCHKTSKKNPRFPLFFGHPGGVGKFLRIIFWWWTKPKRKKLKNGPKNNTPKIGKRYFSPDFLMVPKARVNKRSRGGRFFDTAPSQMFFVYPPFGGSNFKGRVYANDIILQK